MSAHPLDIDLARPSAWMQPTTAREANGTGVDFLASKSISMR